VYFSLPQTENALSVELSFHLRSSVNALWGEPIQTNPWRLARRMRMNSLVLRPCVCVVRSNNAVRRGCVIGVRITEDCHMHLHYLEKKYGIRINLLEWSGDDYETGTLNALIKIESTDVGRMLLESIAYHIQQHPGNLLHGILEIRSYAEGDCNGSTVPEITTKAGRMIKPVVHFWPKAYTAVFRAFSRSTQKKPPRNGLGRNCRNEANGFPR